MRLIMAAAAINLWQRLPNLDSTADMANAFFTDLLSTISERSRTLLRRGGSPDGRQNTSELVELCEALLSGRGEASGTAMAREVLDFYHELDAGARLEFFQELARHYGPDREKLAEAIAAWREQPSDDDASDLHFASEPRRQELFRRLNRAPGGTGCRSAASSGAIAPGIVSVSATSTKISGSSASWGWKKA